MATCPILVTSGISNFSTIHYDPQFVMAVQNALNAAGYPVGGVDGVYGPQTAGALKRWQDDHPFQIANDAVASAITQQVAGITVAGCSTYFNLGISCNSLFVQAGGPISGLVADALNTAFTGNIFKCNQVAPPPPSTSGSSAPPGGGLSNLWVLLGLGVGVGVLIYFVARERAAS